MRRFIGGIVAVAMVAIGGCSSTGTQPAPSGVGGTITVFAAASLTESFTRIGHDFEADHPGTTVVLNLAGSSALAAQINAGAPADVFAAASPATMATVTSAGNASEPSAFARNQLVIAVPKGNPRGIRQLSDLAAAGLKVALCAPEVPCGAAAAKALSAAGVTVTPVTLEQDVKAALTKVRLGEVDAALVYRTDTAAASSDVDAVEFPESAKAIGEYQIAVLADAPNRAGAEAFVAYVRSSAGEAVLAASGFLPA